MNNKRVLYDLFQAYYLARKNKRKSISGLFFERNYETNLFQLGQELVSGQYEVSPSNCFISFKPLKREIFAATFRDRVVHHLVYRYISPIFECNFIYDNYSCRTGRGTSLGIKRINHFIRSCTKNYTENCYILKLDILGYFIAIDKNILYQKIKYRLDNHKKNLSFDRVWLLAIIHKIIFNDPTINCQIKGKKENWQNLPKSKSLFYAGLHKGLPIGNLTSQLFGNVYLDDFDHFMKYKLGCKYYGRYVDDMVIVHPDKEYLKSIIPIIRQYLKEELFLELHPQKIYLQPFKFGVDYLGIIIKPYRMYIRNRTKGNFYKKIQFWNKLFKDQKGEFFKDQPEKFLASINSYLGMMRHFSTYRLRRKILTKYLLPVFGKQIEISSDYGKITWLKAGAEKV